MKTKLLKDVLLQLDLKELVELLESSLKRSVILGSTLKDFIEYDESIGKQGLENIKLIAEEIVFKLDSTIDLYK